MTCMSASRAKNKQDTWEQIQFATACVAASTLSYTEQNAVRELLKVIKDGDCIVVISDLSNKIFVARSVISSALRKLESSEIITVQSLGVKGTHIRINNYYIYDAIKQTDKRAFEHHPPKFLF